MIPYVMNEPSLLYIEIISPLCGNLPHCFADISIATLFNCDTGVIFRDLSSDNVQNFYI